MILTIEEAVTLIRENAEKIMIDDRLDHGHKISALAQRIIYPNEAINIMEQKRRT